MKKIIFFLLGLVSFINVEALDWKTVNVTALEKASGVFGALTTEEVESALIKHGYSQNYFTNRYEKDDVFITVINYYGMVELIVYNFG